ncbi:MAG: hypothetical protein CSB28_02240 [Desulfobacterales bacterium]|nr:MAG: hypothetical protein CSB28_02240 [Desulfobacterales bacterium]
MYPIFVAEYLTFVTAAGKLETSAEIGYQDENIWLPQKIMATLYEVTVPVIKWNGPSTREVSLITS